MTTNAHQKTDLRNVLIVSPRFPPINAPDHQRVRMSLPYFSEFGWNPVVLALKPELHPEYNEGVNLDWLSAKSLPASIEVIEVGAIPAPPVKAFGASNLGVRCLYHLNRTGRELIAKRNIDVAYFSTTMFPVMALGRKWYEGSRTPYVLDFQDPWLSDYYDSPDAPAPPGGKLKFGISQSISRALEPYALRKVNHIISVSPAYPEMLMKRYDWLNAEQFTVMPFGAPTRDFEIIKQHDVRQSIFDKNDGKRHWVYVGRGGGDMTLALRALFLAIHNHRAQHSDYWSNTKLHFVGTNYAAGERAVKLVEPLAHECGVGDLVEEHVHRINYFEALKVLLDSDVVMVIGSNDASYTASKVYPCILAKKPLFALFHEQSSVVNVVRDCNAGRVVTFDSNDVAEDLVVKITPQLNALITLEPDAIQETDWHMFEQFTAREMTRKQCAVFDKCCSTSSDVRPKYSSDVME